MHAGFGAAANLSVYLRVGRCIYSAAVLINCALVHWVNVRSTGQLGGLCHVSSI